MTDKTQSKDSPDEGSDGALYAYHFIALGDSIKQTWRVYDYVKKCPVDMFLYFVDKTFAVTDLNKDGKGEVWIMYKVSCQGDVSPVSMKIIMYQDNKKFAVRGTTRVPSLGGDFTFDEAFKSAPANLDNMQSNFGSNIKWRHGNSETCTDCQQCITASVAELLLCSLTNNMASNYLSTHLQCCQYHT